MLLAACAVFLILRRDLAANGAHLGMTLCFTVIIPSVFPFAVVSGLFVSTGACEVCGDALRGLFSRLFGVRGQSASVLLLGLVAGYPVCTYSVGELYRRGAVSKQSAEYLIGVTNNATPCFIIGFVGVGLLKSARLGVALYLCVCFCALVCCLLCRKKLSAPFQDASVRDRNDTFAVCFTRAVTDAVPAILTVCGFIILFSVLSSACCELLRRAALPPAVDLLLLLPEITSGFTCCVEAISSLPSPLGFAVCGAACAFSGFCVHFQVTAAASAYSLRTGRFFLLKCAQSVMCFFVSLAVFYIFFT